MLNKTWHASARPRPRELQEGHACAAQHSNIPTERPLSTSTRRPSMPTGGRCGTSRIQRENKANDQDTVRSQEHSGRSQSLDTVVFPLGEPQPEPQDKRRGGTSTHIPAHTVLTIRFSLQASRPVSTCPPPTRSSPSSLLPSSLPLRRRRCPRRPPSPRSISPPS